ncbi:MAG: TrmH family RNA methyltransferase [Winogradskyella sp.]|uniref:TrmH family RNA methyltransferase n=1 Tax=Winogradskyella sp. TaxID=1883156 RepID=UPI000F3EF8C3|nr:TrmH family RNA methyltransferase [Winogradskyella sp.]RNC87236.1 MAG: TrmH family RNA methyltransferase [Winogradskyella sp.]
MQRTHYNSNFKKQQFPITIVCDAISNAPNIGSLFRVADAFGVEELIFCGEDIELGKRMKKTSRSTEKYVNYKVGIDINKVIQRFKEKDYQIIALEITTNSKSLYELQLNKNKPIVLVLGNENLGISEGILSTADDIMHINMYGENSSMNVVQATSIALYEITNQLNS